MPVPPDRSYDRLDASGSTSGRGGGSPRPARSTWPHSPDHDPGIELFARIREGLIRGEHVDRMGMALWLYEYLQLRCYFTGPQAGTSVATYTHLDAAKVLNRSVRTIKLWMDVLVNNGYVKVSRGQHGLVITIAKYQGSVQKPETVLASSATSCTSEIASSATSCTSQETDGLDPDNEKCNILHPEVQLLTNHLYTSRALSEIQRYQRLHPPLPLWSPIFFGAPRFPAGALRFPDLLMQPVPPVCPDFRRPNPPSSPSRSRQPSAFP